MKATSGRISELVCVFFPAAFFLSISVFGGVVFAQTLQNAPPKDQEEGLKLAPIPMVQPVTQQGGGLAIVDQYHLHANNRSSSSSSTAVGGFITGNRSWGAGAAQKFFFDQDRWRAVMAGTYVDVKYNYYGIGTAAGDAGESVLLHQKALGALGEMLYRFHGWWYGGARYRFLSTRSSFRPNPIFDPRIPSEQLDVNVATLGPRITRDTRSELDYPRDGSLFDLQLGFSGQTTGGDLNYQTYDLSYSKYFSVGSSGVFAVRGAACLVGGNVPFFAECLLTASENLRGYRASRYRDRAMLASQGEYRWEAWKNLGFVAFGGLGQVGPRFGDFSFDNVLPGGGVGARYKITKESHVNLRFDYAWGKNSHETYFFIGEAF
jgi:Omp85 superfamily domain